MSGKCSEEINTKEKDVETRRIGNLTPSFSRRTQKFKGQQKIETSSGMQPHHRIEIVPQENISVKTKATSELSTSDFSNSSGDLLPSEDEPSSSYIKVKKHSNPSVDKKYGGTVLSNDEGISDGPNNDLSSDESTTYENEGSSTEDSAKTAKCFTFSSITNIFHAL